MTWNAGHADAAVRFELFLDDRRVASTQTRSYTFTGLACGTAYVLGVVRVDPTGARSEPVSITAAPRACVAPDPPASTADQASAPAERAAEPAELPPLAAPLLPGVSPEIGSESAKPEPTLQDPWEASGERPWEGAGAFVWHETDIEPETLGAQLLANGFSWVAVRIHDGLTADPIEGDWVRRFRAASGLRVGGWGVLRTDPEQEADFAHGLLADNALDFYIANPEAEYKYSGDDGWSAERYDRSQQFVQRFRELEPDTPAAVSSYCRANTQDIDWKAWSDSGFAFLPQAYVNDLGGAGSPTSCAEGAAGLFPSDAVHPTVGVYPGQVEEPSPERYTELLDAAGTVGFSVYLAETQMHASDWRTFGNAIAEDEIARTPAELPEDPPPGQTESGTTPSR